MSQEETATMRDPLDGAMSASYIMGQHYPPPVWVVPGLIPEGTHLLVAAPKIGKSWFVLQLACAAATGGQVLEAIRVNQRPVLYLALEDSERRLQSRMKALGFTVEMLDGAPLYLMPYLDASAELTTKEFIERNENALVIIDTLGRTRDPGHGSRNQYQEEYAEVARYVGYTKENPGACIIFVHHTNKGNGEGDFLGAVSGTQGLAGAADATLHISRDRGSDTATLRVTGRDVFENSYSLVKREAGGGWVLNGDSLEAAAQAVTDLANTQHLGDTSNALVEVLKRYPEGETLQNITSMSGLEKNTAQKQLQRLIDRGLVVRPKRGFYALVASHNQPMLKAV